TREGNQIRRNCTMSFTVNSYNRALEVLTDLSKARCRNLISNVQFSSPEENLALGPVSVSAVITFYETMVDGVPDSALPADKAAES
ncbi:MAG: hypothetical protein K5989_07385, partial [Lachnospiraceae bacterium]|nr:hypothetical protein [Lachnospiraceae bacterium]